MISHSRIYLVTQLLLPFTNTINIIGNRHHRRLSFKFIYFGIEIDRQYLLIAVSTEFMISVSLLASNNRCKV